MKRIGSVPFLVLVLVLVIGMGANVQTASAKTVKASVSGKRVKVGGQLSIKAGTKGVRYQSSDSAVASVNASGVITGKKAGKVTITVKKAGYQSKKIALTVKAVKGKPSLDVALDEVQLTSPKIKKTGENSYQYSAVIKNTAKQGKVLKVKYYYQVQVKEKVVSSLPAVASASMTIPRRMGEEDATGEQSGTGTQPAEETAAPQPTATTAAPSYTWKTQKKTVVLTAQNIKPGKKSARVKCEGDASGTIRGMQLTKVELYTGEAVYTYRASTRKGTLKWSDVDLTGPEITGWVGKKSVYNGEPVWICYADKKDTYRFKDHVKAVDARDGKVPVTVDTSKIKWNKEGIYKVYYTAKDKSGNKTKAWAKVQVYKPGVAEKMADIILSTSIKSGSDVQKLRSIYEYVKGHCSYVGSGSHTNWRATAVKGIRNHSGDCFTYYSISKLLITRAGIPHIMIRRYPERTGSNHWWNLVYVKGGWYHFDTTPRSRKGYFCLQTDAQLHMYSTGSTFRFREELYPKRATKKISRNPI